ncbi:ABC transporter ATP-binding protein [Inquilinus sp. CAU 1745]|uniref:ABC transporter ATP-binding protein n=1 Tax=Inquilinus sp. CAU 1745 TaxID=3140369 RepID=UPI00325AFDB1
MNAVADRPVLSIEGLSLGFRSEGRTIGILDDVSLSVGGGRCLCLVGESGSGKSVTALAVMGLLDDTAAIVDQGAIRLDGDDLRGLPREALRRLRGGAVSMIFQEPMTSLNPVFTVGEQLVEGIRAHQSVSRAEARGRAVAMLEKVRIPSPEQRMDEYPHQLSGGMRQRVMIAMALANDPKLLIADEPTTALDVTIQAQILELVRQLQEETGTAVLMITHDLGVVAEVADDVAVMYAGQVVERASVADLFDDPQHPYTIGLMSAMPTLGDEDRALTGIPGAVPAADEMPAGCRFSTRCPFADDHCRQAPPPLAFIGDGDHAAACWKAPIDDPRIAGEPA